MDARALARALAAKYGGRVKRGDFALPDLCDAEFVIKGARRAAKALYFEAVFDGGCLVGGTTRTKPPIPFSFNRHFFRMQERVADVRGEAMPAYRGDLGFRRDHPPETVRSLQEYLGALWQDERSRRLLRALQLTKRELLALLHGPLWEHGLPTAYLLQHSTDLGLLESRFEILDELLPPPAPQLLLAPRITEQAYRMKIGARGAGHRFGGKLNPPLACPNCRTPVHLILTIDTQDPALRLPPLGRRYLPVVYCLNCMSWGTLYVDYANDALRLVRQDKADKVNDDDDLEERGVSLAALASPASSASKIGGSPSWLQGPQVPQCARCEKPMAFLAQLKSLRGLAFGDEGVLYCFVCRACGIAASFIQSH